MSAPKHTSAKRPVNEPNDGRAEWLAEFQRNVASDRTARGAWDRLVKAGLETEALRALWTYAHPPTAHVEKEQAKVREINRKVKALIRADKLAVQKAGNRRATLFLDRSLQKYKDIVRSEMPFEDDGVAVRDWMRSRAAAGKGVPDLAASRKAFVSLGPRGPIPDRKFWLFILLCYAKNADVSLGAERLAALASCADPDFVIDARTLARFLRSLPKSFKDKCQDDLRNFPAPPLSPE